jgi:hypothetical protein
MPGDGLAPPQASDTPPPEPTQLPGTPDGYAPPPGDAGNPNGGQPGGENPDGTPRPPPPPRTLREQAFAAFRAGNDVAGFKLLNAHYAVVPSAKEELAQKMNWVPGLARPALAPRIGVAVQYLEVPLNWKGSPMPIGSPALTQAVDQMQQKEAADQSIGRTGRVSKFGRGRRGAAANFSENAKGDPMANAPAETQLSYYLGDIGDWFLEAFEERAEAGEYGRVLKDLTQQVGRQRQPAAGGPGVPGGDAPGGFGPGGEGAPQPGFDGPPGGPGGPGGFAGGGRGGGRGGRGGQFAGGRGGQAGGGAVGGGGAALEGLPGEENAGIATVRRWSTRAADKLKASMGQVRQLAPCVVWLGKVDKDEREELEKRADAADVDILALFEMKVRAARTENLMNTTTTLKLINLKTKKPMGYSPEPMINLDVERWRQKDVKGTDPVEAEIVKAIEALDRALKPVPLPEGVTAERAKKRITDLVAAKPEEPLPVMVEARYYVAKGLLSEQDFIDAGRELIGETGMARLLARAKEGEQ